MNKMKYILAATIVLFLLASCNGGKTDIKQPSIVSGISLSDSFITNESLENIYYMFPSPANVLTTIKEGGLVYESSLLNSVENREKYVKPSDQCLNLGVYLADLSYCALFSRNSDAQRYLETIKRMSNGLNLGSVINKGIIDKLKDKNYSVDSLVNLSDEFFFKLVADLEDNNRHNELAIISVGAYIECLYLSTNCIKNTKENKLIQNKIAEQKSVFNNLYMYCKKYIPSEELKKTFSYIEQINDAFGQFSQQKNDVKVTAKSKNQLTFSGGDTPAVKDSEFIKFKESITNIRMSITK